MDFETANCKLNVSKCKDMESLPIERPLKPKGEVGSLQQLLQELHVLFSQECVNVETVSQLMMNYKSNPADWKRFAKFDRFRYTRNLVDAGNGLFNVMVLCWGPGHASAVHDHADSHCFMKMLRGELEEIRYDWPEHSKPAVLKEKTTNITSKCFKCHPEKIENVETGRCQMECVNDRCHNCTKSERNPNERAGDICRDDCNESTGLVESGRTRLEENDVCYINDSLGLHRVENPSHVDGAVSLHLYCPPFDACRVFDASTGRPTRAPVTFWSVGGKRLARSREEN